MPARKRVSMKMWPYILTALCIGLLAGLAIMYLPNLSTGTSTTVDTDSSKIKQETVIINQAAKQPSPFLYENVDLLQNPPSQPFNMFTRGPSRPYQQIGVLQGEGTDECGKPIMLPLIGRQTHPGSTRYHYYTSTNGYHPMKLTVQHKSRQCSGNTGCDEIYNGDVVNVKGYSTDFKADVYPPSDLVYIS